MSAVPVEEQLRILRTGTVDLITEADLRRKLATGRPLRAKLGIDPTASDIHLGFAVFCASSASSRSWATPPC